MKILLAVIALVGHIKAIIAAVSGVVAFVSLWFSKRSANAKKEEIQKASDALAKTNEISDDKIRLKEKSDAACKLEKLANPDSDCDAPRGH